MKTVRQILQFTQNTARCLEKMPVRSIVDFDNEAGNLLSDFIVELDTVRDKCLPLLQFNYSDSQETDTGEIIDRIRHNVKNKTHVDLLPDGFFTHDVFGSVVIETPSLMDWQVGNSGKNFVITYDLATENQGKNRLSQLITDMLLSLPGKSIRLHIVDLTYSAQAIFLTKHLDNSIYGKLISSRNEWDGMMNDMRAKMSNAIEEYGDVVSYNDEKQKIVVPYDVIVLLDYRKSFPYMQDLRNLFENGSKGGIYFVLMNNVDNPFNDSSNESLLSDKLFYQETDVRKIGRPEPGAFVKFSPFLQLSSFEECLFNYINEEATKDETPDVDIDYAGMIAEDFRQINASAPIPVGFTPDGRIVDFNLDTVSDVHYFILGQSGTGKSVFLHNIILGGMARYSPLELQFYLMDFKIGGVEFNRYRDEKHVKALLVDNSDAQITLEILREIAGRMKERGKLLRKMGVSNIVEYNKMNPDERMPRIVFVADECHVMFPSSDDQKNSRINREIASIMTKIAKEGRSQGVHLVLATQTLAQSEIPREILNNITDFFLLKCAPTDSEILVSGSSEITGKLKTGQVLHHGETDEVFKSNYLPTSEAIAVIDRINKKAEQFTNKQFYFVGSQAFKLDDNIQNSIEGKGPVMVLGRSIDTKMSAVTIPLKNEYADNLILFGINDEEQVSRTTMAALRSMVISTGGMNYRIIVINCLSEDNISTNRVLNGLASEGKIELVSPRHSGKLLRNIALDIKNEQADPMTIFILGQERFRELRMDAVIDDVKPDKQEDSTDNPFGFEMIDFHEDSDNSFDTYRTALESIIKNGAEQGVHVVLQIDKPKQLLFADYFSPKEFYNMFHHLVILKCDDSNNTSLNVSDEVNFSNLSSDNERLRALYYNDGNNKCSLFTPFV